MSPLPQNQTAFPLAWPATWKRTPIAQRTRSPFFDTVPVGVVRELTAIMERDSKDQGALASVAKKLRMKIESAKRQASADAYADIAFRLRLLTGDTTERQPPSNAPVRHEPKAVESKP